MKYAWLVIGVFAARFFSTAISFPAGDGDLYWQRRLGAEVLAAHAVPRALPYDAFTATGAPWVPQEWLFGILAYLAGSSGPGWWLFAAASAFAAVGAIAITAYQAERRGASPRAVALCTALVGISLFESFGVRAQVVAWPMLALVLFLLDCDGPWAFAAIGVAALWSNFHASAMLAPVVAAISTVGSAFDERGFGPRTRRYASIALGCAVAICCNPFGWDLPRYALGLFHSPITQYISEWKVTDIDDSSFALGALPLAIVAAVFGLLGRSPAAADPADERRFRDLAMLCAFGFLVLGAARNVGVFAIVAAPIVAPLLTRRVLFFARVAEPPPTRADRLAAIALPVLSLAVALGVAAKLVSSIPPQTSLADKPLAALAAFPGRHDVFCTDFAWCSLALGNPRERVFLDGRADPFPNDVWADFASIIRLDDGWQGVLARRGVNAVVVKRDEPLDQALTLSHRWRAAYADASYRLWIARSAQPSVTLERVWRSRARS